MVTKVKNSERESVGLREADSASVAWQEPSSAGDPAVGRDVQEGRPGPQEAMATFPLAAERASEPAGRSSAGLGRGKLWQLSRPALLLLDYGMAYVVLGFALKISPAFNKSILAGALPTEKSAALLLVAPVFFALGSNVLGLHNPTLLAGRLATVSRAIAASALGMALYLLFNMFFHFELVGRYIVVQAVVYNATAITLSRFVIWSQAERTKRRVLVYGTPDGYQRIRNALTGVRLPMELVGFTNGSKAVGAAATGYVEREGVDLCDFCREIGIADIVVEMPRELDDRVRQELMECTASGLSVMDLNFFVESRLARVEPDAIREDWFWSQDPLYFHPIFTAFKRATDVVISLAGLVASAPLFPLIALAIKLQDRGPVFYSQLRVGQFNRPFWIYKFRTMRVDAEKHGAAWADKTDNRVTWLGRLLRKTRLDEIPQFWNVLKGEMSLIGPRPERPEMITAIEPEVPFYRYRHLVKPGITGWAQINYPYGASVEDSYKKLTYDLYYVKNASFTLDLQILLGTVLAMVRGAR